MMEHTNDDATPGSDSPDNIELASTRSGGTAKTAPTIVESSMDIEQSMPTVAELTYKSESEDNVKPRAAALCVLYTLPFLVIAAVVAVVVAFTVASNNQQGPDLRTMSHDEAFAAVVEYLGEHDISDYPALVREGSFQNQAAKWMAHGDPHSISIPRGAPDSKAGYGFLQRYVLALLYIQMDGPNWKYDVNFLKAESTCDWSSWIVRKSDTLPMGAICNKDDFVSELVFGTLFVLLWGWFIEWRGA